MILIKLQYFLIFRRRPPAHRSLIQSNGRSRSKLLSRGSGRNTEATELQGQSSGRARLVTGSEDGQDRDAGKTETRMSRETSFISKMITDEVFTDLETATVNL